MKYAPLLLAGLAIVAGVLGFFVFAGASGLAFRYAAAGLLIVTALVVVNRRNIKRPVPSSFAASFRAESE